MQLGKLDEARRRLDRGLAQTEQVVRSALRAAAWQELAEITPEQWRALSPQAQRDIYDLIVERVTVNPATAAQRVEVRFISQAEVRTRPHRAFRHRPLEACYKSAVLRKCKVRARRISFRF